MQRKRTLTTATGTALLVVTALTLGGSQDVTAADAADGEALTADPSLDIADFYAWPTDDGKIVAIVTFAPLLSAGDEALNGSHLYTIHIDNTSENPSYTCVFTDDCGDNESDLQIHVRFGQNGAGAWGYQIQNVPGAAETVYESPVDEAVDLGNELQAIAGTFDNPFFFDVEGFSQTVVNAQDPEGPATGDIAFGALATGVANDTFAGTNVHAIVVEIDAATALGDSEGTFLQLWATSSTLPAR